jgi:hypothetical protein
MRLVSSCAANFFPALSPEETGSNVRTDNTVPLGTVEARPGTGVSNAERLKERAMKYFVMNFMGSLPIRSKRLRFRVLILIASDFQYFDAGEQNSPGELCPQSPEGHSDNWLATVPGKGYFVILRHENGSTASRRGIALRYDARELGLSAKA